MTGYRDNGYGNREKVDPKIQAEVEELSLVTKPCRNNAASLLANRTRGYPASSRQHPEFIDVAYCIAAEEKHVEAVGRRPICPYIGLKRGKARTQKGLREVYECNIASDMREKGILTLPQKKSQRVVDRSQHTPQNKTFWQRLFGT